MVGYVSKENYSEISARNFFDESLIVLLYDAWLSSMFENDDIFTLELN